jgi:DNA-binding MarR family transcriptional regulator
MLRTHPPNAEAGQQLVTFIQSLHSEGDPQVHRLMDEMRKVAHQLYRLSETSLETADLSYAQYRVLMGLYFNEWLGNTDGLNPSEISERQGTSRNTISALIRGLEEAGLIERDLDRHDRRRFNIRLTEAGRDKVRAHANQHMRLVANIFAVLSSDELETLGRLLNKLNQCAQSIRDDMMSDITSSSGGSHANSR